MDKLSGLKGLRNSEKVTAGSALVLLVASFLPWFRVSVAGFGSATGNGWDVGFFWAGFPVLLGLGMVTAVVVHRLAPHVKLPDLPWGRVHLGAGIAAAAIVVVKFLGSENGAGIARVSRSFGLFLALLAALGLAAGGFLTYQEEKAAAQVF